MLREQLRALLKQRPFQPFRVHLDDGRTFDIRYPDINLLGRHYVDIGIPVPNDPDPVYDSVVMVPYNTITRLEPLPAPAAAAEPGGQ